MKKILVVQNSADEGLGTFEPELKACGIEWDLIRAFAGEMIPTGVELDERGYRGLMVLSGHMSALDDKAYPYLADEVRMIEDALARKLPMLNVGVGAHLLARACRMPLHLAGPKEAGWRKVYLNDWYTQRNPLFFQMPTEFVTFHWHEDTFEVPTEAYRLARSDLYEVQAFCQQGNAYGIQFHPEITEEMIRDWITKATTQGSGFVTGGAGQKMLAEMPQHLEAQRKIAHQLIYGFESTLRSTDYRGPKPEPKPKEEPEAEQKEESAVGETPAEETQQQESANQ